MNNRIKKLRKTLELTQQAFADRLGTTRDNIAGYETGRRAPSVAVISLICREFNVREDWLRTGEGEMFIAVSRSQEISDFMGEILKGEDDDFKRRFVAVLAQLDEPEWELIEKMAIKLTEGNTEKD